MIFNSWRLPEGKIWRAKPISSENKRTFLGIGTCVVYTKTIITSNIERVKVSDWFFRRSDLRLVEVLNEVLVNENFCEGPGPVFFESPITQAKPGLVILHRPFLIHYTSANLNEEKLGPFV